MMKTPRLKSVWESVKGNFLYDVIKYAFITFGGGALLTNVWRYIQRARGGYQSDPIGLSILSVLIVIALLLVWNVARRDNSRPKFVLSAGNLVWIYDASVDKTLFFLSASLVNRGEPSVALTWKVFYNVGDNIEEMTLYFIGEPYKVTVGNEMMTFTNADLISIKTLETPIAKGQFVGGRVLATVPGDRSAQVKALQHTMNLQCEDYLGVVSKTRYIPDSKPLTALLIHPNEKVELIKQPKQEPLNVTPVSESKTL
jgi:hypothetical protein